MYQYHLTNFIEVRLFPSLLCHNISNETLLSTALYKQWQLYAQLFTPLGSIRNICQWQHESYLFWSSCDSVSLVRSSLELASSSLSIDWSIPPSPFTLSSPRLSPQISLWPLLNLALAFWNHTLTGHWANVNDLRSYISLQRYVQP